MRVLLLVLLLGLLVSVLAAKPDSKVKNKVKGKKPPPADKKPTPRALENDTDTSMPTLGGPPDSLLDNETLPLGLTNLTDGVEEDGFNDTTSLNSTETLDDNLYGKESNKTVVDTRKKDSFKTYGVNKGGSKASKKSKRNSPDKKSKANVPPNKKGKGRGKRGQRSLDMGEGSPQWFEYDIWP